MAVIDIGSTAIRMIVAEVDGRGTLRHIESLHQSVSIGKDTFTKGYIEKSTTEECVRALRHFARVLLEYGFTGNDRIKVVATTAVREAANREAFRDRITIASGWQIDILDLADITRLTYVGVRPLLTAKDMAAASDLLIVEMGGGTTDVCFISHGDRAFSQTFRIGSLRLRQLTENVKLSLQQQRMLLQQEIKRTTSQLAAMPSRKNRCTVVALGGEMRLAAAELAPGWDGIASVSIKLSALNALTDEITALPPEKLVKKYHLSFADAETIVPALHFYTQLGNELKLKSIIVASASMRHGILMEMAGYGSRGNSFDDIILGSAEEVARKFHADLNHARCVAALARSLYETLHVEHRLKPRHALLLSVASILHDIGFFVGPRNHHKHSMYLIQNSELFGLNSREIKLVSLIARYHRRSPPKPSHAEYMALEFEERITMTKLAAILRVADALDHAHTGRIQEIACEINGNNCIMTAPEINDASLEEIAVANKGQLFEDVYGLKPVIRAGR
jgi:exopolyphosphatase/guanosine-5'-triphosphate,3'-diphosphate pyrophosphatase